MTQRGASNLRELNRRVVLQHECKREKKLTSCGPEDTDNHISDDDDDDDFSFVLKEGEVLTISDIEMDKFYL